MPITPTIFDSIFFFLFPLLKLDSQFGGVFKDKGKSSKTEAFDYLIVNERIKEVATKVAHPLLHTHTHTHTNTL